jgi:transcriptional regulator with XRE-family HTH domain
MVLLSSVALSLKVTRENLKALRISSGLTQEGLSLRSGVPLPTLRKFEQTGLISLKSFLKILLVLDVLEAFVTVTKSLPPTFASIDEILQEEKKKQKQNKRGWIK